MFKNRRITLIHSLIAFIVGCLIILSCFFAVPRQPLLQNISYSRAVFDRNGELLRLTLSKDEKYRLYTPLGLIPQQFKDAVLLHEDKYFYEHPGFNPFALVRAFAHTYIEGGRKIGASTITMQLVRRVYGINSRTIDGKILQIFRAAQMEVYFSKDEILEAYLNLVSYGYNIEGVGAASLVYFHKHPADLTLPESAALAVIPQSPTRRRPSLSQNNPILTVARNRFFDVWLITHPGDEIQKPYFAVPYKFYGIADLPFGSPHFARHLLATFPQQGQIVSTIDLGTQQLVEKILAKYVGDRRDSGIANASAILVDTRTMQITASVGSAVFADSKIQGQVDGTRALRSPGSTLKPFIYALAIEQGLIHPLSILADAPVNFGSYAPDNSDRDFRGPISARNALRLSRNIPAIKLEAQLRKPDLYDLLQKTGLKLKDRSTYGLSLVLGGASVSAQQLAALYAMLANNGIYRPLTLQMDQTPSYPALKELSPESCFLTLNMLADQLHPYASDNATYYWKTGTSNGFHDAWTVGIFGHYVLVIWVGNFNGDTNPALTGLRAAAPLFFTLADAINSREPNPDLIAIKAHNLNVRKVDVCAPTGDLADSECPSVEHGWFIPGVSPIRNHDIYRKILVDTRSGKRACKFQAGVTEYKMFEMWPTDLQLVLAKSGIRTTLLPPWEDGCADTALQNAAVDGQKPLITSPQSGIEYHVRLSGGDDNLPLSATADGEIHMLHWFVNNEYIGNSSPTATLLWHMQPGNYRIKVVDDQGNSNSTNARIIAVP